MLQYIIMSKVNNWFKIDNAGKIFTQVSDERNPNVFRIAVRLTESIDGEILRQAVNDIMPRFPTFKTKLRRGLFWQFLDNNNKEVKVFPMTDHYCRFIDYSETNGYLFRVSYYENMISLEVFHTLSDGTGGFVFLNSLIYRYLTLTGKVLRVDAKVKTIDQQPTMEEIEDSYVTYYDKKNNKVSTAGRAYHITGTNIPHGVIVSNIRFQAEQMLTLARSAGVTITEYLTALLMYSIYKAQIEGKEKIKKNLPVRVCIPYNLRKLFKSQTLKNFSTYIKADYNFDKQTTFEEVLAEIKKQLKDENDAAKLARRANSTVKIERNFFTRIAPLPLKEVIMKLCYRVMSDNVITTSFSNLNIIRFADSIEEYITDCEVHLFTSGCFSLLTCAVTYKGTMQMSFTRNIVESDIEMIFIRHLADRGIDITLSSN